MNLKKFLNNSIFIALFALLTSFGLSEINAAAAAPAEPGFGRWVFDHGVQMLGAVANATAAAGEVMVGLVDNREKLQREIDVLQREHAATVDLARRRILEDQIASKTRQLEASAKNVQEVGRAFADQTNNLFSMVREQATASLNQQRDLEKATAVAAVQSNAQARASIENARQSLEHFYRFLGDRDKLLRLTGISLLFVAGCFGAWYGADLGAKYFLSIMGRPSLVRESSRAGFKRTVSKNLKSMVLGEEEEPEAVLSDIVLAPDVQQYLYTLADSTRQNRELGLPYQNTLFYGPPGTGKTEFARILAKYSGMDYAILSGADFSQFKNGEGITELYKLFDWAKKSKNGMIIFIDEADACFRNRATLDKDGVNLVNAFLSQTGCSSDKFMIILATNYEDELDAAVRSRIHKKFAFLLPAIEERYKIFMLKLDQYVFNDKRTYQRDDEEIEASLIVDSALTDDFWKDVAKYTEGFSGRDIDQVVSEMRELAYRSGNNMLTKEIVDDSIKQKIAMIKKDREITEYQRKKFEKTTGLLRESAPEIAAAA